MIARTTLVLAIAMSMVTCGFSQGYSSSNKKALKLMAQAVEVASTPTQTGRPNFTKVMELLQQAVEKDPKFYEAWYALAETYNNAGLDSQAIEAYTQGITINPNYSRSGIAVYDLASLEMRNGMYDKCLAHSKIYLRNKHANPVLKHEVETWVANCNFAIAHMDETQPYEPINCGPGVNTRFPEYFPALTVDDSTLLFTRRVEDSRVRYYNAQEDFYVSQFGVNGWGDAVPMPSNINTVKNEGAPTIAPDGRGLVFVCCESNGEYGESRKGYGSCDLFYTQRQGNRWTDPENLGDSLNTWNWETQPSLSADGRTLYFIRGKRSAQNPRPHNHDIYVAHKKADGTWSRAERLPSNVNSRFNESSVQIHPDGRTLYFTSNGHPGFGGDDIFVTRRLDDGTWTTPENLGYPINTHHDENSLLVSSKGDIAYFASDRPGGFGNLDIYFFELPYKHRPYMVTYVKGRVYHKETGSPLGASFTLTDVRTGKVTVNSVSDPVTGEFLVALPAGAQYALHADKEGYGFYSENFNLTEASSAENPYNLDVPLSRVEETSPVILKNVFFSTASWDLRPESFVELDKLVGLLKANPSTCVEIGGHTDDVGDDDDNQVLSQHRAESVVAYLTKKGIDPKRMKAKGYGEKQPYTENDTPENRQLNRRTEYRIIKCD